MHKNILAKHDSLALLALALSLLGIVIPNVLLSHNVDFIPKAVIFYRWFFAGSVLTCILVALCLLPLSRRLTFPALCLFGAYAVVVYIFDIIYPLQIGPMVRGTESAHASAAAGIVQLAGIAGLSIILYWMPGKLRNGIAWTVAGLLAIASSAFLFAGTSPDNRYDNHENTHTHAPRPDFNIYHLVFDSYYGPWLQWALAELQQTPDTLPGFIHYKRNMANYWLTTFSFASFMSGTMLSDADGKKWQADSNTNSLIYDLHERGFSTHYYGIHINNGTKNIQSHYIEDPAGIGISGWPLIMDYWLLRISPVLMRPKILQNGVGPVSNFMQESTGQPRGLITTIVSYRQFKKLLEDEAHRPASGQYVLGWFYPPHPPYQLDRDGNYSGSSSYGEQILLATNMILEFIQTLQALDRLENSLIIIHADHGNLTNEIVAPYRHNSNFAGDPLLDCITIPTESSKKVIETYLTYNGIDKTVEELGNMHPDERILPAATRFFGFGMQSGASLEARYRALLLVKPRNAYSTYPQLTVSDAHVQLLDLRDFIRNSFDNSSASYPERTKIRIDIPLRLDLESFTSLFGHYEIYPDGLWNLASTLEVATEYH